MITLQEFRQIDKEVNASIHETLNFIKKSCREHIYILLLAEGDFKSSWTNPQFSPYVIDDLHDVYQDETRFNFLTEFMEKYYSFSEGIAAIDNDIYRIHLELMVYSHIWESTAFLRKLYRLAYSSFVKDYEWDISVPRMRKHNFIRKKIKNRLTKNGLSLSQTISKGFHSSLRNAFAHSNYIFTDNKESILLTNYGGENWELKDITLTDWSKRFAYSVLLNFNLMKIIHEKRTSIIEEFGKDTFIIIHPINKNKFRTASIQYYSEDNRFGFLHK